ncbi:inositol monophosphatase family protein [Sphingomonas sp. BIUV-7]|uniref:Inositol monophosphatase family protein n=1 Tax=Sphingomonas natans TaxID=3063330 RepID=A0ABT8Y661_9SPHN|nr:inositol monophosphatase family protein [Sphingomonas sp. BIUV-7]MDO6413806.1 inositol monophosphatase family protein [Sphingomonas sp. BIUV-7]
MPAPDADLIAAIAEAAREAGALAARRATDDYRRWDKSPNHPVCEIDLEVDALLLERLMAIDPDAAWLSEETADNADRLAARRVWVVDPIDGTRDYVRGRPGWSVSVALVEDGLPIIGVLEAPARGQTWIAAAGGGATLNGMPLRAGMRTTIPGARVPADTLPKVDQDLVAMPRPNSIALRIAMVASDEVDLCASLRWGSEWDIAAAALIAAEAGAIVTDPLGREIRYNKPVPEVFGILASGRALHPAALERLAERAQAADQR